MEEIQLNDIETELNNKEHWDSAYERMMLKPNFSDDDRSELWKFKEIYRQDIINELLSGEYKWSKPRKVLIAKHDSNKKRVVYIYNIKDRYVLGVLYRVISAFYQDKMSDNCFSYKKSISTSHAIQYIKNSRSDSLKYGVKMDIHAYFNSVNREKVIKMINELFTGGFKKSIENLMLDDRVIYKGQEIEEFKSLIPGCALGSFFANWCLKELDEYFISNNIVYARYSDDIVILGTSVEELNNYIEYVKTFIENLGLIMNPDKFQWFGCGEDVDFLGLSLKDNGDIDISEHSKYKIKKNIHRWFKKGRKEIEMNHEDYRIIARKIFRGLNNKNFKCFINHEETFGWCAYAFPRITTEETLREIDLYTKERFLAMKTGKNNKANYRHLNEDELHDLGWVSLVQLYHLYKMDFDYYCEIIELI